MSQCVQTSSPTLHFPVSGYLTKVLSVESNAGDINLVSPFFSPVKVSQETEGNDVAWLLVTTPGLVVDEKLAPGFIVAETVVEVDVGELFVEDDVDGPVVDGLGNRNVERRCEASLPDSPLGDDNGGLSPLLMILIHLFSSESSPDVPSACSIPDMSARASCCPPQQLPPRCWVPSPSWWGTPPSWDPSSRYSGMSRG